MHEAYKKQTEVVMNTVLLITITRHKVYIAISPLFSAAPGCDGDSERVGSVSGLPLI